MPVGNFWMGVDVHQLIMRPGESRNGKGIQDIQKGPFDEAAPPNLSCSRGVQFSDTHFPTTASQCGRFVEGFRSTATNATPCMQKPENQRTDRIQPVHTKV